VAEKAKFTVPLALFIIYMGEGFVEDVTWWRGLAETSEYRHIGEGDLK